MEFQTLKKSYLKRNIIIGLIVVVIISAIVLNYTKAKYRVTESIPLINGTIHYELSDLNLIGVYIKNGEDYEKTDEIPNTGYLFNESESYCKIGSEVQENMTITYDMKTKNLTISPMTTKGTKCYLYFDAPTNIEEILATKTIETRSDFTQVLESDTTGIIYETEDNEGTSYVYAGAPTDNWVKFGKWSEDTPDVYFGTNFDANDAKSMGEFSTLEECSALFDNCRLISRAGKDMYWRIIRINGNGSLRLIYAGTTPEHLNDDPFIGVSAFNNNVDDNFSIKSLARDILIVPENKFISDLLSDFTSSKNQIAAVVDEHGGIAGIVTIEDIIEEIVGEIYDEFDKIETPEIVKIEDNILSVSSKASIEDINERFDLDIPEEDFQTIGGYVFGLLGREPEIGDVVEDKNITYTILELDGIKITRIKMQKSTPFVDKNEKNDEITEEK